MYSSVEVFQSTVLTVDVHVCAVDLRALKSSSSLTPEQLDTALITIDDFKVCMWLCSALEQNSPVKRR